MLYEYGMCLLISAHSYWFQDIHYMALDKGETALAEVAKRKAEQLDYESLGNFTEKFTFHSIFQFLYLVVCS